jgi:hypothetical protein
VNVENMERRDRKVFLGLLALVGLLVLLARVGRVDLTGRWEGKVREEIVGNKVLLGRVGPMRS